jgi:hypothetical protein
MHLLYFSDHQVTLVREVLPVKTTNQIRVFYVTLLIVVIFLIIIKLIHFIFWLHLIF